MASCILLIQFDFCLIHNHFAALGADAVFVYIVIAGIHHCQTVNVNSCSSRFTGDLHRQEQVYLLACKTADNCAHRIVHHFPVVIKEIGNAAGTHTCSRHIH